MHYHSNSYINTMPTECLNVKSLASFDITKINFEETEHLRVDRDSWQVQASADFFYILQMFDNIPNICSEWAPGSRELRHGTPPAYTGQTLCLVL
ncbi:hypothetical protein CEXT_610151 [Caerostris extrusa]|uniref:Uncharacterized protein n=1 Tax=Caerostris extrusa TaxID=172846 RepID=A0AAV4XZY5_CAEEX|nr:hypothetical protein CEXT_610151 [Caerostris extrusa]